MVRCGERVHAVLALSHEELIIRAVATTAREQDDEDETDDEIEQATGADPQQALVEACARQVLTILKRSKER